MVMDIATSIIDLAALSCLIWFLYSSTAMYIYRKRPFLVGIILSLIVILAEMGTMLAANGSLNIRSINILCNILGFALTPIIPVAIAFIFDGKILRTYKLLLVPTLINIVATVLSPLFGFVFFVDANNYYFRGDYYFIFISVYLFNFLLLMINTLEVGKKYNYPITGKLVALSFFTIVGTSIQLIHPSSYSSLHCVTLSLLLYFILISEFDSSFDPLTGLYNRATFDKVTKQLVETNAFCLIVIDINDFKTINDTYGHDYGDTVIKTVAATIRKSFDNHYTCYRLGGDEFFVIGNEADPEKIQAQLSRMTQNLVEKRTEGIPLPTVSYGYSIFQKGEKLDFHRTLQEADRQMYHYKKLYKADAHSEKRADPF